MLKRVGISLLVMAMILLLMCCLMTSLWSVSSAKKKGPLVTDKVRLESVELISSTYEIVL